MPKRFYFLFCLLLCLAFCTSCQSGEKTPKTLLDDFCATYKHMPAGQFYYSGRTEWENGYLSPVLADGLFAEDSGKNTFELCREYAIFLSSSFEGGEVAFLSCSCTEDAIRVAEMCAARIARVRQITPQAAVTQNACVLRRGHTVVLMMLPDNEAARRICERLL